MAITYSKKVMEHFLNPKNMGEIKDADGIGKVGNPVCLFPKSIIETNPDLKTIDTIEQGTRVLSHNGMFNIVAKTLKREYAGEIINIKNRLGATTLTPEHEVLSIRLPKTHHFLYLRNKRKFKAAWHHAFELEKGDIILYPILKETVDTKEIDIDIEKKKFDFKSKTIPNKIELSEDFLRLCGYYLAEGDLTEEVTKVHMNFSFGITENEYADDVINITKNIFGIEAKKKVKKEHNVIVVTVNNVFIVRLFSKLFGKGAANKSIPHFMMLLEPEKQKSLIKGLWLGDGFVNYQKPRLGYSTISYKLCQQIKKLLLRQRIIPSAYIEEEKNVKGVHHKKTYRIHVGRRESVKILSEILGVSIKAKKEERNDAWIDDNFAYIPITDISKRQYEGFVHNLSVDNTSSFVTDSLTVHNCGDIMWIYIKVGFGGRNKKEEIIKDIKFKTLGCAAAIATSSMITELAKGKTFSDAMKITRDDVKDALGDLPPIKLHCSNLAADGLHEAIYDYLSKNKRQIPKELRKSHERAKRTHER